MTDDTPDPTQTDPDKFDHTQAAGEDSTEATPVDIDGVSPNGGMK